MQANIEDTYTYNTYSAAYGHAQAAPLRGVYL